MAQQLASTLQAGSDQSGLTGLVGLLTDIIAALGPIGVGVLVALETVVPPIPSELILPLSGYLASQGRMSLATVIIGATVGSLVGTLALYWAGAALGQQRLRRLAERTPLFQVGDLERAEQWFSRHGGLAVLIGRVVPVVRSLVSVPAGVEGLPLWRFMLYTVIGSGVYNLVLVGFGLAAGLPLEDGRAVLQLPQLRDLCRDRGCRRTVRGQAATPPRSPPAQWNRMSLSVAIGLGTWRAGTRPRRRRRSATQARAAFYPAPTSPRCSTGLDEQHHGAAA